MFSKLFCKKLEGTNNIKLQDEINQKQTSISKYLEEDIAFISSWINNSKDVLCFITAM